MVENLNETLRLHKLWAAGDPEEEKANLSGANLSGANIDYSCWPLSCKSNGVIVCDKIARQLAAHFCAVKCDAPEYAAAMAAILEYAKGSHYARDLGLLVDDEEGKR